LAKADAGASGAVAPGVTPLSPTAPQFPSPNAMTPQQMADIAAQSAARVVGQMNQPQQQTQQFTQEDFNKTFNIPTVDNQVFQAITGYAPDKPEQVQALNNFAQGIIRAAVTMSNFQLEQARQQVVQQMAPVVNGHKEQVDAGLKNEFFTTNAHLKDFEPLVQEISKGFAREGRKFASKDELFKAVAGQAALLLGRAMPQTNVGNPTQNTPNGVQPSVNGSQRLMTPAGLATGGQTSASSRPATNGSDVKAIFG
jgi:hypothetical protein